MADEFSDKPYAPWLETVIRDLVDIDPLAISIQMRDADGKTYTCYWNMNADDRAIIADAIQQDRLLELIRDLKDDILGILNDEEDDDGLCEADTEADSEG